VNKLNKIDEYYNQIEEKYIKSWIKLKKLNKNYDQIII